VQLDAMRLLTRTQRFTMLRHNKDRRRIDKLHATNERLRRKLDRTLGRRLLKLLRRRERQAAPPAADAGRD
jgi:hypothetical protein